MGATSSQLSSREQTPTEDSMTTNDRTPKWRRMNRLKLILGSGAIVLSILSTAFITTIVVIAAKGSAIFTISTIAAALNLLSLITSLLILSYGTRRRSNQLFSKRCSIAILGLLPSVVAAALSISSYVWIDANLDKITSNLKHSLVAVLVIIGLVLSSITLLQHTIFYSVAWRSASESSAESSRHPRSVETPHELPEKNTSSSLDESAREYSSSASSSPSSTIVDMRSGSRGSFRNSLTQAIRPVTSRTKLINKASFNRESQVSSMAESENIAEEEDRGFDIWDTTSVHPEIRRAILQSASSLPDMRGSAGPAGLAGLETIPQSRSPSPCLPPGMQRDISRASGRSGRSTRSVRVPTPQGTRSSSPHLGHQSEEESSRLSSLTSPEAHIHPLFRSDSPTPPPTALPGTTVIASPIGGQIGTLPQSLRSLRRTRSDSLPSSVSGVGPSPLFRENRVSRSFDDDELRTLNKALEKNPSAVSIEDFPLPGFVLSAGERNSLVGYGKRKAGLTPPSEREERDEMESREFGRF
jgi:hypothetical protein